MKKLAIAIVTALAVSASGCAALGPNGILYQSTRTPREFEPGRTTNLGAAVISGEACAMSILYLVAVGDWSIEAALERAGASGKTLKNIAVDHRVFNVLGIYQNYCTRVTAQVAQ